MSSAVRSPAPSDGGVERRRISADASARPPAPRDVWDFERFETWREPLWRLLEDVLTSRVRAEFLRSPPEYVTSDELDWLDDIVRRAEDRHVEIKSLTAQRLATRYTRLRAGHATRTDNLARYYREGLRPLDLACAADRAREIFLGGAYPEIGPAQLEAAITEVGGHLREGRVWFEANERQLITFSGHYLLYGGEYLLALAASLEGARDYRQVLKAFGAPTMFVCDVPMELVGGRSLAEFAGCALETLFEHLRHETFKPDPHRGAAFCIRRPLAPEHIVGHYHPVGVRDPFAPVGHRLRR